MATHAPLDRTAAHRSLEAHARRLAPLHVRDLFAAEPARAQAFASLLDEAGVDILLIGDSLGNVLQGRGSTAPWRPARRCGGSTRRRFCR